MCFKTWADVDLSKILLYDVVSSPALPQQKSFCKIDDIHLQLLTPAGLSSEITLC